MVIRRFRKKAAASTQGEVKPKRKAAVLRERPLQKDCVRLYGVGLGHRSSILFHIPNGEERHPAVAAQLSGIGLEERFARPPEDWLQPFGLGELPGSPDFALMTAGGKTTWIELKTEADELRGLRAGKLSKIQQAWNAMAAKLGHTYVVVRNQTEFWDVCAAAGVKWFASRPIHFTPPPAPANANAKPRRQARQAPEPANDPGAAPMEPPGRHRWSA